MSSIPHGGEQADEELRLLDLGPALEAADSEPVAVPARLFDRHGRVRLSYTRVETYAGCPLRFRFAFLDRLPGTPGPHRSFGTSIHRALESFYDRKLPRCPTEQELLGFLYSRWDASGFAPLPRAEQMAYYRHAQDVLRAFHRRHAPVFRLPAATEARFELPLDYEAVVVGSIDRVDVDDDGRLHVVDYKTSRRILDRETVAASRQLALYALACRHLYGALPATVSLDFVVPGVTITVPLDELDLEAARRAVLETAAAVRAETYPATPGLICESCDFRSRCPAWSPSAPTQQLLGPAVEKLASLRRRMSDDLRALRDAEATVARLTAELDGREARDLG